MEEEKKKKPIYKKVWFWIIIVIIIIAVSGSSNNSLQEGFKDGMEAGLNTSNNSSKEAEKPSDLEIMSYAQTVLEDNLNNPKYSSLTEDYTIINTDLRYKIEGNVTINGNDEKFYIIIEFVDNTYKEYDLISLQVGKETIYKK